MKDLFSDEEAALVLEALSGLRKVGLEAMAVLNGEGLQAGSRPFEERDFAVPAIDKLIARFDDSDSKTGEDRP
jgi:hypothetical protein